jgi:AraC-like DNA-binding protein
VEVPARGPGRLRDLPAGYFEWLAPAGLRDAVACVWAQVTTAMPGRPGLVLPDACSDLIWEPGRGAYIAGPDTGPMPAELPADAVVVGVRFRPSAGGPALGLPLSELLDQRVDLADLKPAAARTMPGSLSPEVAADRALALVASLVAEGPPDPAVTRAARLLRDPAVRAEEVAAGIGLSPRQLRRRCQAAVGYGPKTLQRVLRFRRFLSQVDATSSARLDLAAMAADAGYADQAHLTRECAELSGLTPAALVRHRVGQHGAA